MKTNYNYPELSLPTAMTASFANGTRAKTVRIWIEELDPTPEFIQWVLDAHTDAQWWKDNMSKLRGSDDWEMMEELATEWEAAKAATTEAAEAADTNEEEHNMKTENELLYEKGLNKLREMFATGRDMHRGAMEAGARWGVDDALLAAEVEAWEARSAIINKHIAAMEMARRCEENKRMGDVKRSQVAVLKRLRGWKPKTELTEAERAALIEALDYASIDI